MRSNWGLKLRAVRLGRQAVRTPEDRRLCAGAALLCAGAPPYASIRSRISVRI